MGSNLSWGLILDTYLKISSYLTEPSLKILQGSERYDQTILIAAAQLAGVHELILKFPQGYDTYIGSSGGALSGGQRQRIALARAVFGSPKLLILDEPNSNLDDQGEKELVQALNRIKLNGCTTLVITHRTMILQCVDKMLMLKDGQLAAFGPRNDVLAALQKKQVRRNLDT